MRRLLAAVAVLLVPTASMVRAEGEVRRYSIHPSISVTVVANDNVYLEDKNPERSIGALIRPGLELGYRGRTFEVGADLAADVRRFLGEPSLAQEFWRVSGFAEVGLMPGLTARISDAFVPQPIQLGLPESGTVNQVQSHRIETQLRYWRELPRAREVEVGLRGTRFLSESFRAEVPTRGGGTEIDDHFHPNYWEGAVYAEIENPLGRLTSVYLRTQARYRAFDETPQSDFMDFSGLLGLRTRRFRNIEIELAAGWGRIQFDSQKDRNRFVGKVSLSQRLSGGWTWQIKGENRFTVDLASNQFLETTARLEIEKRFGERTSAMVGVFVSRFENEAWDSEENWYAGGILEIRRQLTRKMQAKLRYRHWTNQGDYTFDDFEQNQIALEIMYRY